VSKSKDKGDQLEYVVRRVEEIVLEQDPDLIGVEARIERNRRFRIDDVALETDVLVTVGSGPDRYHHLIECKNWQKPVGPDVISHLQTKRLLLRPRHTTLIAREVTASAQALARKFGIAIAFCAEEFIPLEVQAPFFTNQAQSGTVSVQFYPSNVDPVPIIAEENEACVWRGDLLPLASVLQFASARAMEQAEQGDARRFLPGIHTGKACLHETYALGEFLIQGVSVARIYSIFDYSSDVVYPTLTTRLGVKDRGGLIRVVYPEGTMGAKNLALEIVTRASEITPPPASGGSQR
jgi:hypothetical protein